MTSSVRMAPEAQFPNLAPDVVQGYLTAPEHTVAEVLDGELFVMPRPRPLHAVLAMELAGELFGPFFRGRGGPGGWIHNSKVRIVQPGFADYRVCDVIPGSPAGRLEWHGPLLALPPWERR